MIEQDVLQDFKVGSCMATFLVIKLVTRHIFFIYEVRINIFKKAKLKSSKVNTPLKIKLFNRGYKNNLN